MSEIAAADIMRAVIKGVHHCHHMGVIHRDIKPENFLIGKNDGAIKAADYGLSMFCKRGQVREASKISINV